MFPRALASILPHLIVHHATIEHLGHQLILIQQEHGATVERSGWPLQSRMTKETISEVLEECPDLMYSSRGWSFPHIPPFSFCLFCIVSFLVPTMYVSLKPMASKASTVLAEIRAQSEGNARQGSRGRAEVVRTEACLPPQPTSAHISALLRFLASVMISWSRTETSSRGG